MSRPTLVIALLLFVGSVPAAAAELTVYLSGAAPERGQFLVAVFSSEESWMKAPVSEATVPVSPSGAGEAIFRRMPAGTYGISVIYDENRDGELNTNFLGIPTERFGFSNNAKASFGPPSWEKSRFDIRGDRLQITIRMDSAD